MKHATVHQVWFSIALMAAASAVLSQAQVPLDQPTYVKQERLVESGGPDAVEKAAFLFFREIAQMEEMKADSAVPRLRGILKLDEMAAKRYLEYIQGAVSNHDQLSRSMINEICRNRNSLTTPEALSAAMKTMEVHLEAREVQLVKESELVLSAADKFVADTYVSTKILPNLTLSRTDFYKRMKETGELPEILLRRLCDGSIS